MHHTRIFGRILVSVLALTTVSGSIFGSQASAIEISGDQSDSTSVLSVLVPLATILLGASVFITENRRRSVSTARTSLERSLLKPRQSVGVQQERFDRLIGQADVWDRATTGKSKLNLQTLMGATRQTNKAVVRGAELLTSSMPNGIANGSTTELGQARVASLNFSKAIDAHEEALDRLTVFGARLDHHRLAVPTKKELLAEEIAEAERLGTSRMGEAWQSHSTRSTLTGISQGMTNVSFESLELDLLSLSAYVDQAEGALFVACHYLERVSNSQNALQVWSKVLDEGTELGLRRTETVRQELGSIAHAHGSSSWGWAFDTAGRALEELELARGQQELAMAVQLPLEQLEQAWQSLEQASIHLLQADRMLDEVDDLIVDLQQSKIETPRLLRQADEILNDLSDFVASNVRNLDATFKNEPGTFADALVGIRSELELERPHYLRVAETVDRINRRLDESLAGANSMQVRARALRREADREVARADRALRRAERSLSWELAATKNAKPTREGAADRFRSALGDLPDNPQQRIVVASNIADGALQMQERAIARRRRPSARAITSDGGGFGGGWSDGSGSKGASWSGGSGSSTGGRSFSGSVLRGGRSFSAGRRSVSS